MSILFSQIIKENLHKLTDAELVEIKYAIKATRSKAFRARALKMWNIDTGKACSMVEDEFNCKQNEAFDILKYWGYRADMDAIGKRYREEVKFRFHVRGGFCAAIVFVTEDRGYYEFTFDDLNFYMDYSGGVFEVYQDTPGENLNPIFHIKNDQNKPHLWFSSDIESIKFSHACPAIAAIKELIRLKK